MAMLKTRLTACALAVAITTTTMPARAGWMEDFYQSAGSAADTRHRLKLSARSPFLATRAVV